MVVDNMEKRCLAKRVRSPEDGRSVSVTLTKNGLRFIENIFPQHVESIVAEFEVLNPREHEALRHQCRKLGKQERDQININKIGGRKNDKDKKTQ